MKVFLIFLSLFIVNITLITYQGDMNRYLQLRTFLKFEAEECAGGASLYYDEEAYGNGKMVIAEKESRAYINRIVTEAAASPTMPPGSRLTFSTEIVDDEKAASDGEQAPSVTVTLHLDTPDLFRLPFLKVTEVTRKAKYQLSSRGD